MGFLRVGIFGFGGGMACLPLIKREVVDKYGWLDEQEFTEIVTISNTLPGPINAKMAGYVGYRVSGVVGSVIAVCAEILPSVIALIVLLETLTRFRESPIVAGMIQATVPVVGVMLGLMAWKFLSGAAKDLKWLLVLGQASIVVILVLILNVHPAIVIAILIAIALLMPVKKNDESEGTK